MARHEKAALGVEQRLAVDDDASALRPDQAGDDVDQARLARTRAAEQRRHTGLGGEARGEVEGAARMLDVDLEAHVATRRAPMRRASNSEPSSASIEIATDTRVSRNAPASPPGTWVRV